MTTQRNARPSRDRLLRAIQSAGYLFENEVGREFERAGYQVQFNVNYEDEEEGLSREIDIVATDAVSAGWPAHAPTWYYTQVVAACRASSSPVIFFTRRIPHVGAPTAQSIPTLGSAFEWPSKQILEEKPDDIPSRVYQFFMKNDHRLTTPRISSQFCVVKPRGGDGSWEASQGSFFNESLSPLVKAVSYLKRIGFEYKPLQQSLDAAIYHPVIVLRDKLYSCDVVAGEPEIKEADHIVFNSEYISKTFRGHVLIDVITRQYLEEYIALIKAETQRLRKFLEGNFEEIEKYVAEHGGGIEKP
ncbi:MAG: hypothetical protein U9N44_02090 [Chloroflexota bacterium]|nr:hypothetical protein [Chloroflexota bacterium]